jgi:hypothetical protein
MTLLHCRGTIVRRIAILIGWQALRASFAFRSARFAAPSSYLSALATFRAQRIGPV